MDDVESLCIMSVENSKESSYISVDYTSRLLTATTPDECESPVKELELEKTILKKDFAL